MLTAPMFIASILVLLVNDHVLKAAWPGLVTGKLSDVAGVVMMALLVTALLGRPKVTFAGVAVAFAALKTVPAVADLAVPVLGGRTLTDATDLVALLALVPLWYWMHATDRSDMVVSSPVAGVVLLSARIIGVGAAVAVTSATSCLEAGVNRVYFAGDDVVATTDTERYVSTDGGRSWDLYTVPFDEPEELVPSEGPACIDGDCFELVERGVVRIDAAGDEIPEFVVTDEQFENLVSNFGDDCSHAGSLFSSITVTQGSDGANLVVTVSEYGVLHRSADGEWTWRDVGPWGQDGELDNPPTNRVSARAFAVISIATAGVMVLAGFAFGALSARRRHSGWLVALQMIAGAAGAVAVWCSFVFSVVVLNVSAGRGGPYWVLLFSVVPAAVFVFVIGLVQLHAKPMARHGDNGDGTGVPPPQFMQPR